MTEHKAKDLFDLTGKTVLITGAGGLLAPSFAEAICQYGGNVILTDVDNKNLKLKTDKLKEQFPNNKITSHNMNVCHQDSIDRVLDSYNEIYGLINAAAKDPKVKKEDGLTTETRFETMSLEYFQEGMDAIINGTFLCSQAVINKMLKTNTKGVVINISSDLSVIAPDQRIYKKEGLKDEEQSVKPIGYSASKYAVIGMTKYLATYFSSKGIRVNALSPTGVYNNHPEDFVEKLSNIIPMGRMADLNEYQTAILFMLSPFNTYFTGHNLVVDGGKSVW